MTNEKPDLSWIAHYRTEQPNFGLERMNTLLALRGNPHKKISIIHIAGTNGKGSTIATLRELLRVKGLRVGTFTSPYITSYNEQIAIDGQAISTQELNHHLQVYQDLFSQQSQNDSLQGVTEFEIMTALAYDYFAHQAVDVAIIEVGMGGLLDSTNVCHPDITAITTVGLDHVALLGSTLGEIAEQKAGIFKVGSPAVIGPLPEVARQVCRERAKELNINLYEYGQDFSLENKELRAHDFSWLDVELGLSGTYQEENAAVAVEAFLLFMERQSWNLDLSLVKKALAQTSWAGRLEKVCDGIYLDGAHNLPAVERLVEFIKQEKDKEVLILFGALKRKDYSEMLHYLQEELPQASLFLTSFSYGETIGEQEAGELPFIRDYRDFLKDYLQDDNPHRLLFVTGSLYFIAEVRQFLKGEIN